MFLKKFMIYKTMQTNAPIPNFHKSVFSFIFYFLRKKPLQFLTIVFLNSIEVSQSAFYSIIFGKIIEKMSTFVGNMRNFSEWRIFIIAYISIAIFLSVCQGIKGYMKSKIFPWLVDEIRTYYFIYSINHSYLYFLQHMSGELITRTVYVVDNSISIVEIVFDELIPSFLFSLVTIFIFSKISFSFILIFFGWLICHFAWIILRRSRYSELASINSKAYNNLLGIISDIFSNIFQLKISSSTDFETNYFRKYQNSDISSYNKVKFYDAMSTTGLDFIYSIWFQLIFIFYLIKKWLEKSIATSQVIQINQTMRSLVSYIWISSQKISKLLIAIAKCKESLKTINVPYSSLDLFPENRFKEIPQFEGSVRFSNICFSYKMNTEDEIRGGYLIENFNLFITPNSRVALVGSSGSGKSTVFQLITRLIEPIKGKIEINGQDISKIGKKYLAQEFSFIPQKQLVFHRPLFENIGYGCEKIRNYFLQNLEKKAKFENLKATIREKIVEASKNADCHDFIINLKDGYNSVYGPDVGFSGGQLQRIMIARAFVNTDSKFLLLDEATSALDRSTEKTIKNSINKLSTNKTVIMIAHKLDLIKDFDRILVFDRGSIVEDGTHDELIALEKVYYKLAYLTS